MRDDSKLADKESIPLVLGYLRRSAGSHAWALQDLQAWPEKTTLFYREPARLDGELSYLLLTGHPGAQQTLSVTVSGTPEGVAPLLAHLPKAPFLMRETPATLLPLMQAAAPQGRAWIEQRMEATRASFKPRHAPGRTRRLNDDDAAALAAFNGAPPQAAPGLLSWIRGAMLFGVWEGPQLMAVASTFVRVPEVWDLVGIRTRPEARGKGYATEVTSALAAAALEAAPLVTLTALKNNAAALKLYGNLGFQAREDRIWFDNGTGSSPEF